MKNGYSKELVKLTFSSLHLRVTDVGESEFAKRESATIFLRDMECLGLIESDRIGCDVFFNNVKLLNILSRE